MAVGADGWVSEVVDVLLEHESRPNPHPHTQLKNFKIRKLEGTSIESLKFESSKNVFESNGVFGFYTTAKIHYNIHL